MCVVYRGGFLHPIDAFFAFFAFLAFLAFVPGGDSVGGTDLLGGGAAFDGSVGVGDGRCRGVSGEGAEVRGQGTRGGFELAVVPLHFVV